MKPHKILLKCLIVSVGIISCGLTVHKAEQLKSGEVKISWENSLGGDFSFKEEWDYPEGVYTNDYEQLSCDGLCPNEIERMKDGNGRIYEDSLKAFYLLVDTTHQFHSIQCKARTYEWAGTDFVTVRRINTDTTILYTHNNAATHSSLNITIIKNKCVPTIELNSVVGSTGILVYPCKNGEIKIDKNLWDEGLLKADFNFIFYHKEKPAEPMFCKGKIYAAIESK